MLNTAGNNRNYRVVWGVILGYFMVQLSLVPVTAMLPTLRQEMQIGVEASGWIMTIYLLSLTGFLLIAGRLGDQLSHQRIFKLGLIIFAAASLFAGFATDYIELLISRGIQGFGAALLTGNSMAIVHKASGENRRGKAIAMLTTAAAFGSLLGIIIGSIFIQYMSWRWVFFIGAPLAVVSFFLVKETEQFSSVKSWKDIDIPGGVLLYAFLILFTMSFGSSHSGHGGETTLDQKFSLLNWDYLTIAVICFAVFIIVEKRAVQPMVFFAQFRNKGFSAAIAANFILHFVMISVVFLSRLLWKRD